MKKLLTLFTCAAIFCTFAGCSDDDGADIQPERIFGVWELYKTYEDKEWDHDWGAASGNIYRLEFRTDGTMIVSEQYPGESMYSNTVEYMLQGTTILSNREADTGEFRDKARILSLKADELVLGYDYGGQTDREYYKRLD